MPHKPVKAVQLLFLIICVFLSGCQADGLLPEVTGQPTGSARTPSVVSAKTIQPTHTPTATATPTIPPHLSLVPGELKGTEVNFWHPWAGETASAVAAMVNDFNQSNEWGIKVKVSSYYSAGALFDAVTSGAEQSPVSLPEVIAGPEEQLAYWSSGKSLLFPLEDYIQQAELGLSAEQIADFNPLFWQQNQYKESQFGIPALRSANVLFYNQTWAKELGFQSAPKTPAEFKAQACAAAVKNNSAKVLEKYGTGGWLIDNDALTILSWMDAFSAQPLPGKVRQGYQFDSKEGQAAFAFLRSLQNEGCAWLKRMQTSDDFFSHRFALFYSGTLQDIPVQKRLDGLAKNDDKWTVIAYPREDGSGVVYSNGYSLALTNPSGQVSPPLDQQKKMKAGWLFIRWLSQAKNLTRLGETMPSLPVGKGVETLMKPKQDQFPWNTIFPLQESIRPAPATPTWRIVRRLVEDAGWQVFQLPSEQVNTILPHLDASIKEILK
jgi:multiple sugar transport system substrate-binding protein